MKVIALTTVPMLGLTLPAQCVQQSMPPFAGAPLFFSLDGTTAAAATPLALFKCEGFTNAAPQPWTSTFAPDFNLDSVFRNLLLTTCRIPAASPLPDVDAISLGLDWVLSDSNGRIVVPQNRWGAINFTVLNGSQGAAGSAIRLEAGQPEGAGTDVFTFVLPGSTLPAHLVGRTMRLHDGAEMGLPRTPTTIDALDQFIPLYRGDSIQRSLLSAEPTLYFSVTNATLDRVPASWWAGTPPSGATVFKVTWDAGRGRWVCVSPWRTYAAFAGVNFQGLGLTQCEDVDGMAIDLAHGHMLLSTTGNGCLRRNQILYRTLLTDGDPAPVPYSTQTGRTVSDAAGLLGPDDVRAICSLDPDAPLRAATGGPANPVRIGIATPATTLTFPGVARTLDGTMFMACWPGTGAMQIKSYGLGWPGGVEGAGVAAAYITVAGSTLPPTFLAAYPRNPRGYCGDPRELALPVPNHLRLLNPAFRFAITWVAADSATLRLGQAFPVALDL